VRRRSTGRLLKEARVSLEEEDMENEVDGERTEVEESCKKSPVLRFHKDGAEAIEELERSDDLALHQGAGQDGGRGPPASAEWHLEEPLFEGESSAQVIGSAHHLVHDGR